MPRHVKMSLKPLANHQRPGKQKKVKLEELREDGDNLEREEDRQGGEEVWQVPTDQC